MSALTPVPGWPGVYVSELTAGGALELQDLSESPMRGTIRLARLCGRSEAGAPLWADDDAAAGAPMRQVKAVAETALRVSGLSEDVEALAGN